MIKKNNFKFLIHFIFLFSFYSANVIGQESADKMKRDSINKSTSLLREVTSEVMNTPYINSIGISACEFNTGKEIKILISKKYFSHCIKITASRKSAIKSIQQYFVSTYGSSKKVKDVYIIYEILSPSIIQPGMSGGSGG